MATRSTQIAEGQQVSRCSRFELRRVFDEERSQTVLHLCLRGEMAAPNVAPPCASLSRVLKAADERVLVLENFEGLSLDAMLRRGPVPQDEAFAILRALAPALDALHGTGRSHGALQPACILTGANQQVRIVDWMVGWNGAPLEWFGRDGAWLSPERIAGWPAGAAADQFALGAIAHQMLSGQPPFGTGATAEVLFRVRCGLWRSGAAPLSDAATMLVYERVFAVQGSDRFPDCTAFAAALEEASRQRRYSPTRVAEDTASSAADAPQELPEAARPRRAGVWWGAATAAAVAALVLAVAGWVTQRQIVAMNSEARRLSVSAPASAGSNSRFAVCNTGLSPVTVRELAAAYWGANHRLQIFNSARVARQGWTVAPASSQSLSWPQGEGSVWDGSVLFYFTRIRVQDSEYIVSGEWDSTANCLDISGPSPGK